MSTQYRKAWLCMPLALAGCLFFYQPEFAIDLTALRPEDRLKVLDDLAAASATIAHKRTTPREVLRSMVGTTTRISTLAALGSSDSTEISLRLEEPAGKIFIVVFDAGEHPNKEALKVLRESMADAIRKRCPDAQISEESIHLHRGPY